MAAAPAPKAPSELSRLAAEAPAISESLDPELPIRGRSLNKAVSPDGTEISCSIEGPSASCLGSESLPLKVA